MNNYSLGSVSDKEYVLDKILSAYKKAVKEAQENSYNPNLIGSYKLDANSMKLTSSYSYSIERLFNKFFDTIYNKDNGETYFNLNAMFYKNGQQFNLDSLIKLRYYADDQNQQYDYGILMRMRPMQVSWFYLVNVKTGEKVSLDDSLAYFWVEPY